MKEAYLYIRVSTDEQAEKGYSQRNQEELLRRYCQINSIEISEVIFEDHSAKSFNRPEWKKLLIKVKRSRSRTKLVLFTKWDRFSRNAGDSYQMINLLNKMGAEPHAIEQPLDLSIPENKMMLAFYLASPEVENDRRALNVAGGMRKAKKEGRWMGTAPIGYKNKIDENRGKYIGIDENIGPIMKWAFTEIAANRFNTEQIWKMARERGLNCSKNNFWVAIRNPVFYGKIFVPPFKEEKGYFVTGQHTPLITEELFITCQNVLDNRKRVINTNNYKPKAVGNEKLPLRGFLECPKCKRSLSGSASKGRKEYYYYYHCTSECGTRYVANKVNLALEEYLMSLIPKPEILEIAIKELAYEFKAENKVALKERNQILLDIEKSNKRISNARVLFIDGELSSSDFNKIKEEENERLVQYEIKLGMLSGKNKEIEDIMESSLMLLSNVHYLFKESTLEVKRNILGSIFPEKLHFDGMVCRTGVSVKTWGL